MSNRTVFLAIGATPDSARAQIQALEPYAQGPTPSVGDVLVWDGAAWVADRSIAVRSVSDDSDLTSDDDIVLISTTTSSVTLRLPSPVSIKLFVFKKTTTDTHTIVLTPQDTSGSGPSIEGGAAGSSLTLPSSDLALRCSWTVVCDGSNWWLV